MQAAGWLEDLMKKTPCCQAGRRLCRYVKKTPLMCCQQCAETQEMRFQVMPKQLWPHSWIMQIVGQWIPNCETSSSEGTSAKGAATDAWYSQLMTSGWLQNWTVKPCRTLVYCDVCSALCAGTGTRPAPAWWVWWRSGFFVTATSQHFHTTDIWQRVENRSKYTRAVPNISFGAPPLPFGRICFVVLVMRKGGESSWSGPWRLGCTL